MYISATLMGQLVMFQWLLFLPLIAYFARRFAKHPGLYTFAGFLLSFTPPLILALGAYMTYRVRMAEQD